MCHVGLCGIEKVVEETRLFFILIFLVVVQVDNTYKAWDPWKQEHKCYCFR